MVVSDCRGHVFDFVGQHKIEFIPDIVGPILQMTLIPENGKHRRKLCDIICYYFTFFSLSCLNRSHALPHFLHMGSHLSFMSWKKNPYPLLLQQTYKRHAVFSFWVCTFTELCCEEFVMEDKDTFPVTFSKLWSLLFSSFSLQYRCCQSNIIDTKHLHGF